MVETRATSMWHMGMTRESMKEAVSSQLKIGQQYVLISEREENKEKKAKDLLDVHWSHWVRELQCSNTRMAQWNHLHIKS